MALIKCPECGKKISEQAESCPNCGYILNNRVEKVEVKSNQIRTGSIVSLISSSIILVFLIISYLYTFAMPKSYTEKDKTTFTINIGATGDELNTAFYVYYILGIAFTLVIFVLSILYLKKKIKKVKIYKILLLCSSVIELLSFFAFSQIGACCTFVILILPIVNLVGAIIVATGREK